MTRAPSLRRRSQFRHAGLASLVFGVLLLGSPPATADVLSSDVEEALTCQCGCGLTVANCNHLSCGSALPLRDEIETRIAAGDSRDEILLHFRNKYGEKILSSPVAEGFNRMAWILPFAMLGAGTVLVFGVLRRWTGKRTEEAGDDAVVENEVDDEDRKLVEAALRDREER